MFLKEQMPLPATKSKLQSGYFLRYRGHGQGLKSLTLVSFEIVSLIKMHAKYRYEDISLLYLYERVRDLLLSFMGK